MSTDRMDDRFVIIDLRTFGIETLGTDPHYVLVLRDTPRCLARKVFLGMDKQGLLQRSRESGLSKESAVR